MAQGTIGRGMAEEEEVGLGQEILGVAEPSAEGEIDEVLLALEEGHLQDEWLPEAMYSAALWEAAP